jgi:hypothetical protein|nr:MAG TPA_asm: antirestriction protein [Bacteriophage sp.]
MRNYTINDEKTATIRNLYNGDEFTARFPMDEDELISVADRASCYGSHDYIVVCVEGFYNLISSDYVSLLDVNDVAERVERLEDEDADKLEAMAEYCDNLDDIESAWDDSYFINDTTLADYAEELCYECGYMPSELPGWISCHIDWEGVGRELSFDGYNEINGGVLYVAQ